MVYKVTGIETILAKEEKNDAEIFYLSEAIEKSGEGYKPFARFYTKVAHDDIQVGDTVTIELGQGKNGMYIKDIIKEGDA